MPGERGTVSRIPMHRRFHIAPLPSPGFPRSNPAKTGKIPKADYMFTAGFLRPEQWCGA
jgi:hypothetical protein